MGFVEDLKNGLPGLRFVIPSFYAVREQHERRVILMDEARKIGWHVIHAPWRMDLRPTTNDALRRDIERSARNAFNEQYAQLAKDASPQRPPPRTNNPDYSPIIEVQTLQITGAPALLVLRRLAYEPGLEVVLGNLLIPLVTGLCEITAFQRSGDAGQREAALMTAAMQRYPGEEAVNLARRLGQGYFDDPQHDASFPNHPLTLVRGAMRDLLGDPNILQVTAPMPALPEGEVELAAAGCAIVPPPRYLPLPQGTVPVPRTMSVMTRVLLEAGDSPLMLDVWQSPDPPLGEGDRQELLLALAKKNSEEWEKQGATDVSVQIKPLPNKGEQVHVSAEVRLHINGVPTQSVARWIGAPDGKVYRITLGGPMFIPMEELARDADSALASFRQLSGPAHSAWLTSDLRLRPKTAAAPSAAGAAPKTA